jgi:hypothetical protein
MKSDEYGLYRSERGRKAIVNWYNSLVGKFSFPFDSEFVDTRFGKTHMLTAGPTTAEPLILVQAIAG